MAYNPELDKKAHGMPRLRTAPPPKRGCLPDLWELLLLLLMVSAGLLWIATH